MGRVDDAENGDCEEIEEKGGGTGGSDGVGDIKLTQALENQGLCYVKPEIGNSFSFSFLDLLIGDFLAPFDCRSWQIGSITINSSRALFFV